MYTSSAIIQSTQNGSSGVPTTDDLQTQVTAIATNATAIADAVTALGPKIAAIQALIPQPIIDALTAANQSLAASAVAINAVP